MKRVILWFSGILLFVPVCAPVTTATPAALQNDKLAEILVCGTLVIASDANHEPQSRLLPDSSPDANTKCRSIQYIANQMTGFDIEVAGDVVNRDAVLEILPLAKQAVTSGRPIKIPGEPIWFAYASIPLDRSSRRGPIRLSKELSKIIRDLHAEGTLQGWSLKYQEQDLTQEAARYDLFALHQLARHEPIA